jgi:hypothetical protein
MSNPESFSAVFRKKKCIDEWRSVKQRDRLTMEDSGRPEVPNLRAEMR